MVRHIDACGRPAREFQPDLIYERYNLYLLAGRALSRWFGSRSTSKSTRRSPTSGPATAASV